MMVFSLNGTGLRFCGVSRDSQPRICFATVWVCALFLPLFPIRRMRLSILSQRGFRLKINILQKTPLVPHEILLTYLYGWLLIPALLFWPVLGALGFMGAGYALEQFHIYPAVSTILNFAGSLMVLIFIVWIIVAAWKLKDWDENRWLGKA
jgi:hypothetical protein